MFSHDENDEMPFVEREDPKVVTNTLLWQELRYIRKKVDSLESKVMLIFGGFTTVTMAIALWQLLQK